MRRTVSRSAWRRAPALLALAASSILWAGSLRFSPVHAAPGVSAAYGFAEGGGTQARDSSANDITGTLIGNPTWTTGHTGNGLRFNGSNTYVNLGNPGALQSTGSITLSAWVYETANVGNDGQIIARSDGSRGWELKSSSDTGARTFAIELTSRARRHSQTVRALNTWYHVTGVYNVSNRSLNIYVNGVLDNGVLNGNVPPSQQTVSVNASIGRRSGGEHIAGVLDDVRVHDRALTLTEITSDMTTPVVGLFDFSLSNAGNRSVARGSSVTNTITAALTLGTAAPVSFSASGVPAGATATFAPTSCSPPCSTTLTLATTGATPVGVSTIAVTGTGGGLFRSTSFTLTVTLPDTAPPTVSLSAPLNNAPVAGTATVVSASASDNVGVAGVQFLLDGASLGVEDATSPYSVTWNTTTASAGLHTLSARARDGSGNSALSPDVDVIVDNDAPTIGSVVVNNGAAVTNNVNVTLTLAAGDALSGISQMRFSNTGTTYSTAEAYATTRAWALAAGTSGVKTVFVQFRDGAGNWSAAFTDTIIWDGDPPTISAVSASEITTTSTTITWTTNEGSTSQIDFGVTTAYGQTTALDPGLVTAHSAALGGLGPQTTYNYRVRSTDAAGNERVGTNNTVTTLAGPDTIPPSAPSGLVAIVASSTRVDVSWNAATDNVAVTGYDVVRDGVQIAAPSQTFLSDAGLSPSTTYVYTVAARDAAGNSSAPSAVADVTTPAFVITNVQVTNVTARRATITWTTDRPADSQVEYGSTTAYGQSTPLDTTLVTTHSQTLTGLSPDSTYHFRVRSIDASVNLVMSGDGVVITAPAASNGVFQNEILVSGLDLPTAVKFLPDGSMLVLELGGTIRRVDTATWQVAPTPFLALTNIGSLNGQQGLMDLVLDPDFVLNHFYYVFYTLGTPNRDRTSRFTATADFSGTVAGSEVVIYQDPQTANSEHHGGALNFGNDGMLYITTGEHFAPDDAQSLSSGHGKILRFNKDGSVPADNPFNDGAGPNVDAIWALGLRNPFRAYYDAPADRFYIADVGGNGGIAWEEVHIGQRGANYGWPVCEGLSCTGNPLYTDPIHVYPHNGRDASITGGFIYRGSQFPASYKGSYFFADYAQNWIKRLTLDPSGAVTGVENFEPPDGVADGPAGDIVYLTEGPDGAVYYVDLGFSDTTGQTTVGKVRRIRFVVNNQPPVVVSSVAPTGGPAPLAVTFSSTGTFDPEDEPLTYTWDFGDGNISTEASPVHTYVNVGPYTARLTVSDGTESTQSAPVVISVGNPPTPTLVSPQDGLFFRAGDTIAFSGDATDVEDGPLSADAFSWTIDFLHDGHVHPALPQTGVTSGTFVIPTSGHDFSGNTRYRVTLTVTDSDGLQVSRSVVIYPERATILVDSAPSGLSVHLDGIPRTTPFAYETLFGFTHVIDAPSQTIGSNTYNFASWSDGGAQQHSIVVSGSAAPYVAAFDVVPNAPPDLVAGYRFSEASGTTTADLSGNNITGTLTDGPQWTSAGRYGGALNFSGTSYVDLGDPAVLQMTGSMTLTAWIKSSANPFDDGAIIAKLGASGWQLKTSPDTGPRTAAIQIGSDGSDSIQRYSSTVLALNMWYHVAGVYDATARTLSIYVDGVLDNGVLSGTVPAAQFNSAFGVNIGQRTGYPGTLNFQGVIDEPHVYSRALTAAEIQVDMNAPR